MILMPGSSLLDTAEDVMGGRYGFGKEGCARGGRPVGNSLPNALIPILH